MAVFRQKTLVWLTICCIYLVTICAVDAAHDVRTESNADSITGASSNGNVNSNAGAHKPVSSTPTNSTTKLDTTETPVQGTEAATTTTPTTTPATTPTTTSTTPTTTPATTPTTTPATTPTTTPATTPKTTPATTPTTTPATTPTTTPATTPTTTSTTPTTNPATTPTTTPATTPTTTPATTPTTTPATTPTTTPATTPKTTPATTQTAKPQEEKTSPETTLEATTTEPATTTSPPPITDKEPPGSTQPAETTTEPTQATTEVDHCAGDICQNNGTCESSADNFTCTCTPGWQGRLCDEDYCAGVTCEHNGTCDSLADNFTCTCVPGWQGRFCHEVKDYCKSVPCNDNGICTQNLTFAPDYYSCNCSHGITGLTCTEDVHECDNATICGDGICVETFSSYHCLCNSGWTGEHCETDINECESQAACADNERCNNTDGGHECLCEDPLQYIDQLCQRTVLWLDFKSGLEFTRQNVYEIRPAVPFPYYESASRDLFVYKYGYVAFGANIISSHAPYVSSQWPYTTKLFGVYWADIEATNSSGNPSHFYLSLDEGRLKNLSYTSTLVDYARQAINDSHFEPLSVLAATWVNAVPYPARNFSNDRATFQVILATDGFVTYAVSGYRTVWANTNIFGRPFVQTVHSLENGVQSEVTTPRNGTGPVVVKLGAHSHSEVTSLECISKVHDARVQFSDDLRTLPPCPCYQTQALNDDRFEAVSAHTSCYRSVSPSSGGRLRQLCCFDEHGFLLNFTSEDPVPEPVNPKDDGLQDAYKECCADRSWLCDWFYTQLTSSGCHAYEPPFIGGGFGDPHVVTFDGNKYSFNGLGDYVIFKSNQTDTEFRGRTDVASNGKTTQFVAYALREGKNFHQFYTESDGLHLLHQSSPSPAGPPVAEAEVKTSTVLVKVRNRNGTLSYGIKLLSNNFNDSQGLLGFADHNPFNDFLFSNDSWAVGTAGELTTEIINQFAESWKVKTSSFIGGLPITYPANFTSPVLGTRPDVVLDEILAARNHTGLVKAKEICGDELFCLQDFLVEGDPESARQTRDDATIIAIQQNIYVDECAINNGGCHQICHNTVGSFSCDCEPGYSLASDGKTCTDIDECLDAGYCDVMHYCVNVPGSAHCSCYPGLVGDTECIRAPYTYYGSLGLRNFEDQIMRPALLDKSSSEFKALALKVSLSITDVLVNSSLLTREELYVEVLSFQNDTETVTATRAKRDTNSHVEAYTVVDFVIHSSNISVDLYAINILLEAALKGCDKDCQFGQLLLFSNKIPRLNSVADLCLNEDIHHCDLSTTTCLYYSYQTHCKCKTGYTGFEMNFYSCYDIDECAENAKLCGPNKEACVNVPGSYQCDCGKGRVWNNSSKTCVGDKCSTSPCDNDGACFISNNDQGFVCSCTYGWNGPVCADEDTDARRMKIAVISVGAILGFCCLALFIIVVVVCVKQRRNSKETSVSGGYSEIKSTSHSKVTQRDSNEMEENGRGNVYSHASFDRSSEKRTSFNAPVPESKKEGSVYYNKAFENDVVARL